VNWFTTRVMYLSVWAGWRGFFLHIHFLPRYCYRLFWNKYQGFGADRYLKPKYALLEEK
jgi:diadenosine tetraphosphate (Ap4A) HIT family hydrolase